MRQVRGELREVHTLSLASFYQIILEKGLNFL